MTTRELSELEERLGYRFCDPSFLRHALTHSSTSSDRLKSNERLEFLGDRVLGLIVAEILFKTFTEESEGDLGYRFTALARRESLVRVAHEIQLGKHIEMSMGERDTGGACKDGLLADACEAIIAAIYIDGGLTPARTFVEYYWGPLLAEDYIPRKDPKTILQEWAQANGYSLPSYKTLDQSGPDHQPVFCVEVRVGDCEPAIGNGNSKRSAEQVAAEKLMAELTR